MHTNSRADRKTKGLESRAGRNRQKKKKEERDRERETESETRRSAAVDTRRSGPGELRRRQWPEKTFPGFTTAN